MKTRSASHHRKRSAKPRRKWSAKVTATSDAMTLRKGILKSADPQKIARSVKDSAESSYRRETGVYRSAVSMISFYENRGGRKLAPSKKKTLQAAKRSLKKQFKH